MNVCFSLRYSSKCLPLSCLLMRGRNWAVKRWVGTACLSCLLRVDVACSYPDEIMNESSFEKKAESPGSSKSLCLWLLKSVWAARGRLHRIKGYWSGQSRNHNAKSMLKHSHSHQPKLRVPLIFYRYLIYFKEKCDQGLTGSENEADRHRAAEIKQNKTRKTLLSLQGMTPFHVVIRTVFKEVRAKGWWMCYWRQEEPEGKEDTKKAILSKSTWAKFLWIQILKQQAQGLQWSMPSLLYILRLAV